MNNPELILRKLDSIAILKGVTYREPLLSFRSFLIELIRKASASSKESIIPETIQAYSEFIYNLYSLRTDANFSIAIFDALLSDMNPYLSYKIRLLMEPSLAPMSTLMEMTVNKELEILSEIGEIPSAFFKERMPFGINLPDYHSIKINFVDKYHQYIEEIPTKGYGIFLDSTMFTIASGKLTTVEHPDTISVDELFSYDRQRNMVIENTKSFICGKKASDILLYGDAGTGKSSTVKAVSRLLRDKGVRLVELPKIELMNLPYVIEELSTHPMKFILFIDDISFEIDDERIGYLKSVLEGAVYGNRRNVIIYATSNRRHIIRESYSNRIDEMHCSDNIAEQMSLSERFGLAIRFDKPNKGEYIDICEKIAMMRGLEIKDDFAIKAEQFALKAGGRTARLARQFVDFLSCCQD